MSELRDINRESRDGRRSICELMLGFLMLGVLTLIMVVGIDLRNGERPLLLQPDIKAGGSLVYDSFTTSGGTGGIETSASGGNQAEGSGQAQDSSGFCVVLDAGHGASDPGKIGCNDAKEKDINLSIVQKLKGNLEAKGVKVVLTRESDAPLYDASAANKKMSDMNARVSIIESTLPDLVVSIHQNSYHESSVCGPQVFYYKASEKGKRAAECLQASFDGLEEIDNRREAKANDNYYLLLHTSVPLVIAECGFLSNPREAELLIQDSYQEKVAWVLHLGILEYLNSSGEQL